LLTLRKLSEAQPVFTCKEKIPPYPQVVENPAWKDRILNTQLASWTQLRHDTILYAKPSFTINTCCEYPEGYVDPYPAFWRQFLNMANFTRDTLEKMTFPDVEVKTEIYPGYFHKSTPNEIRTSAVRFYDNFAKVLTKLVTISEKQAKNEPLTNDMAKFVNKNDPFFGGRLSGLVGEMSEVRFLKNVIEETNGSGATKYLGWYPQLFWTDRESSGRWDPIVADIHIDSPDEYINDPGCVLYEAVGKIYGMLIAVDRGDSVICYSGPVMSHYEFTMPVNNRLDDAEWEKMVKTAPPANPNWTRSYLVPKS